MSTIDFPTWFSYGCYGGLACCMLAIAVSALYTTLCKRGTTRELAITIVSSVGSALLLLLAVLWFNLRFGIQQAALSRLEIGLVLVYITLWGWVTPLGSMAAYCLFARPRDSSTAGRIPGQRKHTTRAPAVAIDAHPPRRQPGAPAPFVYSADQPWGWLVYRSGKFTGQELALKRSIVSIGREEDNDVWLDDDTISRYHAELAWEKGQIYLTDCNSLNGVSLNGRRVRSSLPMKHGDEVEIGSLRFLLKCAERPAAVSEMDDPLLPHLRRAALTRTTPDRSAPRRPSESKNASNPTVALDQLQELASSPIPGRGIAFEGKEVDISGLETLEHVPIPEEQVTPIIPPASPPEASFHLPFALRLPSKAKTNEEGGGITPHTDV
ncbi:MAG TPA: FHA domain-containing protein [Ktedonobacteraceae bacterium]|nr:FHA domain-containing protein [Ktedonobacteraceae bacterium]